MIRLRQGYGETSSSAGASARQGAKAVVHGGDRAHNNATMVAFFVHWFVLAVALWVAAYLVPGVGVSSWQALAIGALILGFVNAIVRPVLVILTLPITILTLGLFYLIVNGAAFGLAAALVPGFSIASLGSAILGALVVSVVSWFVGLFAGA